jgi:hypothetical protein
MADPFESNYIARPEEIVFRDKVVSRLVVILTAVMALFFSVAATISYFVEHAPVAAVVGIITVMLLLGFFAFIHSVARTVITQDELRVQWGFRDIRIPLVGITAMKIRVPTRVEMIEAMKEPGSPRIDAISVSTSKVLEITWTDTQQDTIRRLWLGSETPQALQAAIQEQQAIVIAALPPPSIEPTLNNSKPLQTTTDELEEEELSKATISHLEN